MAWLLMVFILVSADQISKILIRINLDKNSAVVVVDNFIYISHRINRGAAWSILADKDWGIYVLASISFIASCLMIYLILRSGNRRFKAVVSVICAGSVGNLIDRVLFKGVTDFLELHFGNYVFPTFNVADSLIVCGTIAMVIFMIADKNFLSDFESKGENN
ncbi:MAG: signal peptidase II [Eubacteriales bacterium]|nr:signal peptidase II [Eubacteriales bacterium]MDD4327465.1 signal peptidase II [Eubacteriales bacterium]